MKGNLRKMLSENSSPVTYSLPVGDELVALNEFLEKKISLTFTGTINCIACGRKTSKSFNQGYCFPCMRSLAECDSCIVKPELCHFAQGTCRDEDGQNPVGILFEVAAMVDVHDECDGF